MRLLLFSASLRRLFVSSCGVLVQLWEAYKRGSPGEVQRGHTRAGIILQVPFLRLLVTLPCGPDARAGRDDGVVYVVGVGGGGGDVG